MALQITDACVSCWACTSVCPNDAIYEGKVEGINHFLIDADKCTECLGDKPVSQCAAICPIETAIIDELGEPLNPLGSLTGIPLERLVALGLVPKAA
jgi:ferredoxin